MLPFSCRHLNRSDPIVAVYEAEVICLDQSNQTSLLFFTRHHLYIWDTLTDSLVIEFPVRNISISVSSSSRSQVCIRTQPISSSKGVAAEGGYEMVRQYLQQSLVDSPDQHTIADAHSQPLSTAGGHDETEQGLVVDSVRVDTPSAPVEEAEEGEGLVVYLGELCVEHFCAVWESLAQDSRQSTQNCIEK
jgi:hypothetical protein